MTSINFIKLKNVESFLTSVDEEIDNKYIKNFIYTQIQSQNMALDNHSKIHYTYISKINSYQISIINTKKKNILLEPFVLDVLYAKQKNYTLDLYLCEDFFAFYEHGNLIFFKELNTKSDRNDIIKYVNQTFHIKLDNIIDVDKKTLEEYKKEYDHRIDELQKYKYISKYNSNSATYYLIYLAFVIFAFVFYFFNIFTQNNVEISKDIKNIKLEQVKHDYLNLLEKYEDNQKLTPSLITLFNVLDKNEIKLISLKVVEDKGSIKIKSENKDILLDFLDFYDEDSIINNMQFIKEENCYELYATIKLYK